MGGLYGIANGRIASVKGHAWVRCPNVVPIDTVLIGGTFALSGCAAHPSHPPLSSRFRADDDYNVSGELAERFDVLLGDELRRAVVVTRSCRTASGRSCVGGEGVEHLAISAPRLRSGRHGGLTVGEAGAFANA
jgi:hypothetical protein